METARALITSETSCGIDFLPPHMPRSVTAARFQFFINLFLGRKVLARLELIVVGGKKIKQFAENFGKRSLKQSSAERPAEACRWRTQRQQLKERTREPEAEQQTRERKCKATFFFF